MTSASCVGGMKMARPKTKDILADEGIVYEFGAEPDGDNWTVYRWLMGSPQHKLALVSYTDLSDATHVVQTMQLVETRHRLRRRTLVGAGMVPKSRRG